jgi:hypothetical protein
LLSVLLVVLCILAFVPRPPLSAPAAAASPASELLVVRIATPTADARAQLAALGLDLLSQYDPDALYALVSPQQAAALRAQGWLVQTDAEHTALLRRAASLHTFQGGYATAEEVNAWVQQQAAAYPTLVRLVDIGDSWRRQQALLDDDAAAANAAGFDLWALRLTNQQISGEKPIFFLMATIHAREIASTEIALRFGSYLLSNYGSDPLVTWLLDAHEIVLVPMVNPDGYTFAEQGHLQRKNANTSYGGGCSEPPSPSSQYGVDLNRNYAYQWGTIARPTLNPCSLLFPGDAPASEPETQAIQNVLRDLFPNRPRPADGVPVPASTSGVLISMHSYGDLLLWPWGYTDAPPPDDAALTRLGEQLAARNGYLPIQGNELYPTSGTTDDWAYAELGLAAFTLEIGPGWGECGGFMPPYGCLDGAHGRNFWRENLPMLLYAAQVSHAPYMLPAGPTVQIDAAELTGSAPLMPDSSLALSLTLTASAPLSATELYVGAAPWRGGTPVALQSTRATSDTLVQSWQATLPLAALESACAGEASCQPGSSQPRPLLLVRGRDAQGAWGPLQPLWTPQPGTQPAQTYRLWLPFVAVAERLEAAPPRQP